MGGVGHVGVGWLCRGGMGGVGHAGVGWVMQGGVRCVIQGWSGVTSK